MVGLETISRGHTRRIAGIEIDDNTADALRALADAAGLALDAYLARVAEEKRRERALTEGAEIFRRVTSAPETIAAFDAEYGGRAAARRASSPPPAYIVPGFRGVSGGLEPPPGAVPAVPASTRTREIPSRASAPLSPPDGPSR